MLKPTQMTKLTVIGTQRHLKQVIDELYALNVLHIEEHVKDAQLDIGKTLPDSSALSEIIVKLNAVLSLLKIKKDEDIQVDFDSPTHDLLDRARALVEQVTALDIKRNDAEQQHKAGEETLEKLKLLVRAGVDPGDFTTLKHAKVFVGIAKDVAIRKELKLQGVSFDMQVYHDTFILSVVSSLEQEEQVSALLTKHAVNLVNVEQLESGDSAQGHIDRILKELAAHKETIKSIDAELALMKQKYGNFFQQVKLRLAIENEKAEAPLKFGATEKTFMITGFVPSDNLLKVHRQLSKATDDTIIIYLNKIEKKDSVPIEMQHPKLVKPFEFFMHLYTLPNYKEIDPTFFTFLTFPFFFGFMLGDMGYGLVNLILFLWLKKKMPKAKDFFNILIWASIMTILAGAFFGEFFGFEELGHFHIPHVLSRSHQQMDLLMLSIALGAIHIILALLIGFVNEYNQHGLKHAIFHKVSWLVLLSSAVFFGLGMNLYGGIILGIAVVMLLIGEGAIGLIEMPAIFGNILSYARLMAIGLASVSLAVIINEFAIEFAHSGGFMILAAVALMVVGHVINMLLGLIGPFLHSLRLHYVEFFSKFYAGGGRLFRPFGYDKAGEQEQG